MTDSAAAIAAECDAVKALLLEKNRSYGDSALNPVGVFCKADPAQQIRVRIDDKLSRLARGRPHDQEDTVLDLIGYLVLLRVATNTARSNPVDKPDAAPAAANLTSARIDKLIAERNEAANRLNRAREANAALAEEVKTLGAQARAAQEHALALERRLGEAQKRILDLQAEAAEVDDGTVRRRLEDAKKRVLDLFCVVGDKKRDGGPDFVLVVGRLIAGLRWLRLTAPPPESHDSLWFEDLSAEGIDRQAVADKVWAAVREAVVKAFGPPEARA